MKHIDFSNHSRKQKPSGITISYFHQRPANNNSPRTKKCELTSFMAPLISQPKPHGWLSDNFTFILSNRCSILTPQWPSPWTLIWGPTRGPPTAQGPPPNRNIISRGSYGGTLFCG